MQPVVAATLAASGEAERPQLPASYNTLSPRLQAALAVLPLLWHADPLQRISVAEAGEHFRRIVASGPAAGAAAGAAVPAAAAAAAATGTRKNESQKVCLSNYFVFVVVA